MLFFDLAYLDDRCYDFNGIPNTNWMGPHICCAKECGKFCGAPNCDAGPGGKKACCPDHIYTPCGMPPCEIGIPLQQV